LNPIHCEIEKDGFAVAPQILDLEAQHALVAALGPIIGAGRRGLLAVPGVRALARSSRLLDLVRSHLPIEPQPVRAIYFDKSAEASWLVPWHQDLTLAVSARAEVPGFGPWSMKEGIPHVQPPVAMLEQILSVRLHIDDADESNGALRVIPGTHRLGRLSAEQIKRTREEREEVLAAVSAGDAFLMRPLLLHASGHSISPRHRRVLHIEYAAFQLPRELAWHEAA
jgi:hypothetical protein